LMSSTTTSGAGAVVVGTDSNSMVSLSAAIVKPLFVGDR
jgi:mitochondrial fission protein ELM1